MRIVKMIVIFHVSRAFKAIYILVHAGIHGTQKAEFITPLPYGTGLSAVP